MDLGLCWSCLASKNLINTSNKKTLPIILGILFPNIKVGNESVALCQQCVVLINLCFRFRVKSEITRCFLKHGGNEKEIIEKVEEIMKTEDDFTLLKHFDEYSNKHTSEYSKKCTNGNTLLEKNSSTWSNVLHLKTVDPKSLIMEGLVEVLKMQKEPVPAFFHRKKCLPWVKINVTVKPVIEDIIPIVDLVEDDGDVIEIIERVDVEKQDICINKARDIGCATDSILMIDVACGTLTTTTEKGCITDNETDKVDAATVIDQQSLSGESVEDCKCHIKTATEKGCMTDFVNMYEISNKVHAVTITDLQNLSGKSVQDCKCCKISNKIDAATMTDLQSLSGESVRDSKLYVNLSVVQKENGSDTNVLPRKILRAKRILYRNTVTEKYCMTEFEKRTKYTSSNKFSLHRYEISNKIDEAPVVEDRDNSDAQIDYNNSKIVEDDKLINSGAKFDDNSMTDDYDKFIHNDQISKTDNNMVADDDNDEKLIYSEHISEADNMITDDKFIDKNHTSETDNMVDNNFIDNNQISDDDYSSDSNVQIDCDYESVSSEGSDDSDDNVNRDYLIDNDANMTLDFRMNDFSKGVDNDSTVDKEITDDGNMVDNSDIVDVNINVKEISGDNLVTIVDTVTKNVTADVSIGDEITDVNNDNFDNIGDDTIIDKDKMVDTNDIIVNENITDNGDTFLNNDNIIGNECNDVDVDKDTDNGGNNDDDDEEAENYARCLKDIENMMENEDEINDVNSKSRSREKSSYEENAIKDVDEKSNLMGSDIVKCKIICKTCSKYFPTKHKLRKHLFYCCSLCEFCGERLKNANKLLEHIKCKHYPINV
ncbi:hypothetical protein C0J52_03399 [Blattella germanica]|nr:hypothetical protein C0J52_03399 [Blattella germanica]